MTIRKTLLLACLLVGLAPALLLALLAFERVSRVLQAEIERGLAAQAEVLGSEISQLMVERLQSAATWRGIELMQDLRVGDVDKRLAAFLQRLQLGYGGLYRELSVLDLGGRVVASSDATRIGQAGVAPKPWQRVNVGDASFLLDLPMPHHLAGATAGATGGAAGGAATRASTLIVRTPLSSAFASGTIGELQLHVDWSLIDQRLEQAAAGGRMLALLDTQGRLMAGSQRLMSALPRLREDLAPWAQAVAARPSQVIDGAALQQGPMFVGLGQARAVPGFEGFGWSVLVLVPRDEALAPVRSMALVFAALLGAAAVLTLVVAGAVSQTIARPIVALTTFSRNYRHSDGRGQVLAAAPVAGRGEIGELARSFVQMVQQIEQSQQQLARATALAAVGEMSAVIAHEVRTPLGVILSSAQILQREAQLSDEGRELLSYIESETGRLGRLIASMLEGARPREPQFASTDMHPLVEHAVGLLAAQANKQAVQIQARLPPQHLHLDCDAEQMTQVLLNLILNALQILPEGGRIVVSMREQGSALQIDIADDGPGIAPEARARIFEAFFFQREGGIGLGLAVVQKIITAHGGRIEVGQSELGGALFRIHLPRQRRPGST